jgi:Protein of unknown function (DUF1566)
MGTLIKILVVITVIYGAYAIWHHKHKTVAHSFEVHGGEAYDAATNLTWKRCGVGQEYTGSGCKGGEPGFKWDAAQRTGDSTWRVPNEKEIATLIDPDKADKGVSPAIDSVVFPGITANTPPFWTSSHSSGITAWYARFSKGSEGMGSAPGVYRQSELNDYGVILVRDGR